MGAIFDLIRDGDRRTTGGTAQAAALVRTGAHHVAELMDLLTHPNAAVRLRAADALEKASAGHEGLLAPYKDLLLELADGASQSELRGHLAQIVPRLDLQPDEIADAARLFGRWFVKDASAVVRTFALQGMADLARLDARLIGPAAEMAERAAKSPVASLKARARKVKVALERLKA